MAVFFISHGEPSFYGYELDMVVYVGEMFKK